MVDNVLPRTLFAVFLLASSLAATTTLNVPAVDSQAGGILTQISCTAQPATNANAGVYFNVEPYISTDTEASGRTAAAVAAQAAHVSLMDYVVLYRIVTTADSVDGPSGGSSLALTCYGEFAKKPLRTDYRLSATGTIDAFGTVGTVGGVKEKIDAANAKGVRLMLVPARQSDEDGIDYVEYANQISGGKLRVVEVANFSEAEQVFYASPGSPIPLYNHTRPAVVLQPIQNYSTARVQPLQGVAVNVIARGETLLSTLADETRLSITANETVTPNPIVTPFGLQRLNASLQNAQRALDAGYYYTAANNAFLAKIRIETLQLAIHNTTKANLLQLIDNLNHQLDSLNFGRLNAQNMDWRSAAQLRYYWAKNQIADLQSRLKDATTVKAADYADYALARNWFEAAADFNQLSSATCTACAPAAELRLRSLALNAVDNASNSTLTQTNSELAQHAQGAQAALANGDYATAIYDAAFVTAYTQAIQADDANATLPLGNASRLPSFRNSMWSEVYYSHALYSEQLANQTASRAADLNAAKLAALAKQMDAYAAQMRQVLSQNGSLPTQAPSVAPSPTLVHPAASASVNASAVPVGVQVVVTQEEEKPVLSLTQKQLLLVGVGALVAAIAILLAIALHKPPQPFKRVEEGPKLAKPRPSQTRRRAAGKKRI